MVLTLGMAPIAINLMVALFLLVCVVLILTVLIQRPQGGGLSGAFGAGGGGSGSGQTAFGARTGDALTMATIAMFVIYLGVAVVLNFAVRPGTAPGAGPSIVAPDGGLGGESATDTTTTEGSVEGESLGATGDEVSGTGPGEGGAPPADAPAGDTPPNPGGSP